MKNKYLTRTFINIFSVFGLLDHGLDIYERFRYHGEGNTVLLNGKLRTLRTLPRGREGVSTPPILSNMAQHETQNFSDTMSQISDSHRVLYGQDPQNSQNIEPLTVEQHKQMSDTQMPNQSAPQQPMLPVALMPPPPGYIQSLPFSRMNDPTYQQHLSMNPESNPPQWAMQILQTLQTTCAKLQGIEHEMKAQNTKWQNVEYALNTQNSRISSIEEQLQESKVVKRSVSKLQVEMADMNRDINNVKGQMNQYDTSMGYYNEQYENIVSDRTRIDNALYDLSCQMKDLQSDNKDLQNKQSKTESKVIDLQCRSMCENLIFSGIDEEIKVNSEGVKYEESETVLKKFLREEMDITTPIEFDRVHRLGPIKTPQSNQDEDENTNPRPLIAKFERYKDKQFVKMVAPTTLRNKKFGVNEQYPKEIEETRKTLYGEMKRAKRNPDNKVRMVRDRLYVNDVRIMPNPGNDQSYNYNGRNDSDQTYRKTVHRDLDNTKRSRVFYSRAGSGSGPNYQVDFPHLPSSSSYKPFMRYEKPKTPARANIENNRSISGKKKAVSPLDVEKQTKRQKDLNSSENSHSEHSVMELSNQDYATKLQHENTETQLPMTQPGDHTTDTTDGSIHSENQSGANQSGVNGDNETDNDI